jgi:hypothetical protein
MIKFLTISLITAVLGVGSAAASLLQFSATTDTGEITSFTLDTTVPNTYDPILYPNLPIRGVYLNSVHDLNFEGTNISLSDATTTPGETGDVPATIMEVGPLFDTQSLSLFLIFLDPTLVSPLSSDPLAYEGSFLPFQSVLFPQIPPPRTHVDPLLTLTVKEVPGPIVGAGVPGLLLLACGGLLALRWRWRQKVA